MVLNVMCYFFSETRCTWSFLSKHKQSRDNYHAIVEYAETIPPSGDCQWRILTNPALACRDVPIIARIIGIGQLLAVLSIIGISRLLCRYRPIVIYYILWWHWIL